MKLLITYSFVLALFVNHLPAQKGSAPFPADSTVNPLLETYWGQSCFYNDSCPVDTTGLCGHVRTGCGATAMTQIMKYHNYPLSGYSRHSYLHPVYGKLEADFENTVYDWQHMPPNLTVYSQPEEVAAVAQLMFHAGVSVEMDYGASASSSGTTSIRNAFAECFGYSTRMQLLRKSHFEDTVWVRLLRDELDAGRPVFYGISGGTGGHFIVIDGYTNDGYFHCNWGNGVQAGYNKLLSELPPVQEAIIGLEPDTIPPGDTTRYIARFCRLDDGSGAKDYDNNSEIRFIIRPPHADSIALFFSKLLLGNTSDTLKIFDGPDATSPVLGAYSSEGLPGHLISSSPEIMISFTTDDTLTGPGWGVEYTSFVTGVVSGLTTLTDSTGTFGDGSGAASYSNHTDAYWLISPPGATSVMVSFTAFNTEFSCDYLWIYDGDNTAPENLIGKFSGTNLPPDIIAYSGSMLLHFNTDFSTVRPGWELQYTSGYNELFLDLQVCLEGPFTTGEMSTQLNQQGYLPHAQPYNNPPWNYSGSEAVSAIPNGDIVDWILIELRDATDASSATSATVVAQQAGFLLRGGSIVCTDGSSLPLFTYSPLNSLFTVLWHCNHLGVISAQPLTKTGGRYSYDYTDGMYKAYGGPQAQKEVAPGTWAMMAADGNADGQVNNNDKNEVWIPAAGQSGYHSGDFNLDGEVNGNDKVDFWIPNTGLGCQVPE